MTKLVLAKKVIEEKDPTVSSEICLGEVLEKENVLLFSDTFSTLPLDIFTKCFSPIGFDQIHQKGFLGKKEKMIARKKKKFFQEHILQVLEHIEKYFPFYKNALKPFFSTYLPPIQKEKKINLAIHRPISNSLNGDRIITVGINLDSRKSLQLVTAKESFTSLADKMVRENKFPLPARSFGTIQERVGKKMKALTQKMGFSFFPTSPYDVFMLRLYRFLESNNNFYKEEDRIIHIIPPQSSFILFSDAIAHGIHNTSSVILHSFCLPRYSLLNPEKAPVSILERLSQEVIREPRIADFGQK